MNLSELQNKLLAAARRNPPDEQVPYAFEKRIMARIAAAPKPNEWLAWTRALWVSAAACVMIAGLASLWPAVPADEDNNSFSDRKEHTSELQSLRHLVCRLLLEKKKHKTTA